MVNIHFLKTFISLARTRSFQAAARENSVTQSAVSQQIRTLESRVMKPLILRAAKKLELTPEGIIFLEYAENIVNQYEEAVHKLARSTEERSGTVRLSTIYSVGLYRLQPVIKKFLRKYRNINVHLEYHHNDIIYQRVRENVDDFGLVAFPHAAGRIESHDWAMDELVLIQNVQRPQFTEKTVSADKLEQVPYVALSSTTPTGKEINKRLRELNVSVNPVADFENVETLKSAVHVGMGCAIVPKNILKSETKSGAFEIIKLRQFEGSRPIGIITAKDRPGLPARRLFLESVLQQVS
ncbi:MAG: LysR family transcriptional regulator [Candidatus Omnitrophica bacterium]|nr:LysR family transcriptional regulator [Candidatus Omnitrophota bacterium]MCB9721967.1 LysR family transcriptional regulator [Candidatus Omnitrophota bacterium]